MLQFVLNFPTILVIVFLLSTNNAIAWRPVTWTLVQRTISKVGLSSVLIASQVMPAPALAVVSTFQEQLKVIQALQVEQQKINVQRAINAGGGTISEGGEDQVTFINTVSLVFV